MDLRETAERARLDAEQRAKAKREHDRLEGIERARNYGARHLSAVLGRPVFPSELEPERPDGTYSEHWPALVVALDGIGFRLNQPERGVSRDDTTPRLMVRVAEGQGDYSRDPYRTFFDLPALGSLLTRYEAPTIKSTEELQIRHGD